MGTCMRAVEPITIVSPVCRHSRFHQSSDKVPLQCVASECARVAACLAHRHMHVHWFFTATKTPY